MNRKNNIRFSNSFLLVLLTVLFLGTHAANMPTSALAAERSLTQLEEEFSHEANPKRRVTLALEITEARLDILLAAYQGADPVKVKESSASYLTAIDRLDHAVQEPDIKGGTKDSEIGLRREIKSLGNLRLTLSAAEQPPLDSMLMKVTRLHERILYSLMNLEKKQ